jgi:hypothetical protein
MKEIHRQHADGLEPIVGAILGRQVAFETAIQDPATNHVDDQK